MKKALKITFITLGFIILITPTLFIGKDLGFNSCEHKKEVSLPIFNVKAIHQNLIDFEEYFLNQMGLKSAFIHFNALLKKKLFNSSITPKRVVFGQNNWAFYTDENDGILKSYLHQNLFSEQELHKLTDGWLKRTKKLESEGSKFIFAVWPNKSTIYSDIAPDRLRMMKNDTISRIEQVARYIKNNHSNLNFIDIRSELKELKDHKVCYYRTDTHWNHEGAYLGYIELSKQLDITPFPKDSFNIVKEIYPNGDLIRLSGLCNHKIALVDNYLFKPIHKRKIVRLDTDIPGTVHEVNYSISSEKTLLLFRDSYSDFLMPFLSLHFKNCYYIASGYNQDLVDKIKPDYVVQAKVERYF